MKTPKFIAGERVAFFDNGCICSGTICSYFETSDGNLIYNIEHNGLPYHKSAENIIHKIDKTTTN